MEDLDQHNPTDHKSQNRNILHSAIPKNISGNTKKGIIKAGLFIICSQISFMYMHFKYSLMKPL